MFATVEVRWFTPGLLDKEVHRWFSSLRGPMKQEPDRTDLYLQMSGETDLGIKIRSGRIEIKRRRVAYGVSQFQQGVVGRVDGWRKWGFGLADVEGSRPVKPEERSWWIPITKKRQVRKLQITSSACEPVSPDLMTANGCDIEVTQVRWDSRRWWTLALEAYGPEDQHLDNLMRTTQTIFTAPFPAPLREPDSMSYPAWLDAHLGG